MAEEKKGRGKKRFFLFALILGAFAAIAAFLKRRRGAGVEESEWQEIPPPEGG